MHPPPQPPPTQQHTRINLGDLKSEIVRKLGQERAQRYFSCLNRLLTQKLSKPEFNKFCLLTLGREFIPLHNQLISSILNNAFQAKTPPLPPAHDKRTLKHGPTETESPQKDDGSNPSPAPLHPVLSNGNILPPSPNKSRSSVRDRRIKDRPVPLEPNDKANVSSHQPLALSYENIFRENGDLGPYALKRPVNHHQNGSMEQPAKRQRIETSVNHDWGSLLSKHSVEVAAVGSREDLIDNNELTSAIRNLQAPLGIPFYHSVGGARRSLPLACSIRTGGLNSSYKSSGLCATEALRNRMEKIAEAQGLTGVTTECADLMNNGLDAYLKRLIKSCVELVGPRSSHESIQQSVYRQPSCEKPINDIYQDNYVHGQSISRPLEGERELRNSSSISLQVFKIAMELTPQQLGENWPLLLEKMHFYSFEKQR